MQCDKTLYPNGLCEIFREIPDECRDAIIDRRKREINDYINERLFDDNENPEADMVEFFKRMDFGVPKGQKGIGDIVTEEYDEDTDSILKEVKIWSELAANVYLAGLGEEDRKLLSKEYVGKIISRFVLEQVAEVVNASHDHHKPIANLLFRMIPAVLGAHTKPAGGLSDIVSKRSLGVSKREEKEYKPWIQYNPWETLEKLRRECINCLERTREYEATDNQAFKLYVIRPDADISKYHALRSRKNVVQMFASLDEKIRLLDAISAKSDNVISEESELVAYLAKKLDYLHEKVFDKQIQGMQEIIEKADPKNTNSMQLLNELSEYTKTAKRSFWIDEIMSGRSSIEKLENPELIKDFIRSGFRHDYVIDPKQHPNEFIYASIIAEMKGEHRFMDNICNPLAEMLVKEESGFWYAGKFAYYVGEHNGNPDCIQGMEKECVKVKKDYLSLLNYNSKNSIFDQSSFEQKLKERLVAAETYKEKTKILEETKERLEKTKLENEKMMYGVQK